MMRQPSGSTTSQPGRVAIACVSSFSGTNLPAVSLRSRCVSLRRHHLREHRPNPASKVLPKNPARLAPARLSKQLDQTRLIHDDGLLSPAGFTLQPSRDCCARRLSPNRRPSSTFNNQWDASITDASTRSVMQRSRTWINRFDAGPARTFASKYSPNPSLAGHWG